jgi:outer membrane murein-binding lipoprotein Lpp
VLVVAVLVGVFVAGCASRTAKPKAAKAVRVAAPIE